MNKEEQQNQVNAGPNADSPVINQKKTGKALKLILIFGGAGLFIIVSAILIYIFVIDKDSGVKVVNVQNTDKNTDTRMKELELKEKELDLKQKELENKQNSNNTTAGEDTKISGKSTEAANQVIKWVNALGSKEYSTAFYLMSPSLRGTYSKFISTKGYGGITKTKVLSSETVNSSGCNFEIMATYESFDPYNKSGKYTQKFNVSECKGYWEISSIENVAINYY